MTSSFEVKESRSRHPRPSQFGADRLAGAQNSQAVALDNGSIRGAPEDLADLEEAHQPLIVVEVMLGGPDQSRSQPSAHKLGVFRQRIPDLKRLALCEGKPAVILVAGKTQIDAFAEAQAQENSPCAPLV